MIKVIQLSPIPTLFRLQDKREFIFSGDGKEDSFEREDFEAIMKEYGSYIEPRIKSDENPNGCFIIEEEVVPESEEKKEEAPEVIEEKPVQRKKRVQKKKGK